ncbi:uncharacterized protein MEPE_06556 [Melanopsichium pennsylvanicum]|uniref:t-SNARE coiled-coil homology domain-containing protein n=2 Tax=Melanopsichium pennsylvanicum TaxID=63383 RepID=A0AAJ4XS30_9BASI|nr:putative protein [Melanopsichium pennsylvanicum 4]SNX87845.1 uncharacterized protein MEPE_06556 [Melanopsichium pennsylvanicum]
MSQPRTTTSLADVPMSASARQQLRQYLSRISSSTSATRASGSNTNQAPPSDLDAQLHRSAHLTTRVDSLHSKLSNHVTPHDPTHDPELFWSTLTLLTNLRELSSQLQRTPSDRKASEALAKTQQNVDIIESLLHLLSISNSEQASDVFTAPVKTESSFTVPITSSTSASNRSSEHTEYEYWRQQTLSALEDDADSNDSLEPFVDQDQDDAVSDTDSVLTDPEIHLAPTRSSPTPLVGVKSILTDEDEDELSAYDRAITSSSTSKPSPATYPPAATATVSTSASDTILQSDRATHEALSSELLRMASILKSNSLAFADSLERDRILLEKAGNDLSHNLDLMTRTRGRLGVYSRKARNMGCFTLTSILIVMLSWMLMFLLIRLT